MADTTISTSDGTMPAAWVEAPGSDRAVLVAQEAFGVNDHIVDVCERFAAAGWSAIAPALFHRKGSPVLAYDDMSAVMPMIGTLTADGITTDMAAASAFLEEQGIPAERQAVVGFCMGGTVAFHTAVDLPLGAAATFYGGGVGKGRFGFPAMVERVGALRTPWIGFFGDRDAGIPVDEVEALRGALASAPAETEVVRYAEGQHGFHCDQRPAVYDAGIAADAWARTLTWFDGHVPAR
jgi:carboxymethylenebutenolidase